MYTIWKRYQYYGPEEIQWTDWFKFHQSPCLEEINKIYKSLTYQKEPNKLKNEFKIIETNE